MVDPVGAMFNASSSSVATGTLGFDLVGSIFVLGTPANLIVMFFGFWVFIKFMFALGIRDPGRGLSSRRWVMESSGDRYDIGKFVEKSDEDDDDGLVVDDSVMHPEFVMVSPDVPVLSGPVVVKPVVSVSDDVVGVGLVVEKDLVTPLPLDVTGSLGVRVRVPRKYSRRGGGK